MTLKFKMFTAIVLASAWLVAMAVSAQAQDSQDVTEGKAFEVPADFPHKVSGRDLDKVFHLIPTDQPLGSCDEDADYPHIRVTIPNIRKVAGNIRMSLYGDRKKEWLASGMKIVRFDVPITGTEMVICLPLPRGEGRYAVGMYHDEDANFKMSIFKEGFGVSNNAKRGMFSKPKFKKSVFPAGPGRTDLTIRLRY